MKSSKITSFWRNKNTIIIEKTILNLSKNNQKKCVSLNIQSQNNIAKKLFEIFDPFCTSTEIFTATEILYFDHSTSTNWRFWETFLGKGRTKIFGPEMPKYRKTRIYGFPEKIIAKLYRLLTYFCQKVKKIYIQK